MQWRIHRFFSFFLACDSAQGCGETVGRLLAAAAPADAETRAGETPLDLVDVKCRDLPATRRLLRKVLKSSKQQYEHGGTIYIVPLGLQKLLT